MDDGLWFALLIISLTVIVLLSMFVGHGLESRKQMKRGKALEASTSASTEIRLSAPASAQTASATAAPVPAPVPVTKPLASPPLASVQSTPAAPPQLSRRARRRERRGQNPSPRPTVPAHESDLRMSRNLAKIFYRDLRAYGYTPNQVVTVASELIAAVLEELPPRKQL